LALTVTKESIFDTFVSDNKPDCLLHGHSYTAHPMGSAVAKESIEILDTMATDGTWTPYQEPWKQQDGGNTWSMWNWNTVQQLSHLPNVDSVMSLGSVLAVNLKDDQTKGKEGRGTKAWALITHLFFYIPWCVRLRIGGIGFGYPTVKTWRPCRCFRKKHQPVCSTFGQCHLLDDFSNHNAC
jgi:adenosylmethionine-8-amino-7-oxononanoate aminotransferase